MGNREEVQQAAEALTTGDATVRADAAIAVLRLARNRASLLPVRAQLLATLDDAEFTGRTAVALALLVDSWRFFGLLPTIDALETLSVGAKQAQAKAAIISAAKLRSDIARASQPLLPLLAAGLPQTAPVLAQLAAQGADVSPSLAAIETALEPLIVRVDTAQEQTLARLWLATLGRVTPTQLAARTAALQTWMSHAATDWRFDDFRYRAATLLATSGLAHGDSVALRSLADDSRYPVREAAVDVLAEALVAGQAPDFVADILFAHLHDPAGGVRYSAIKGVARAVAAGTLDDDRRQALVDNLKSARYLSTSWTHPLDAIATGDLGAESAAGDLAQAAATLAQRCGDSALLAALVSHCDAEVVAGARLAMQAAPAN